MQSLAYVTQQLQSWLLESDKLLYQLLLSNCSSVKGMLWSLHFSHCEFTLHSSNFPTTITSYLRAASWSHLCLLFGEVTVSLLAVPGVHRSDENFPIPASSWASILSLTPHQWDGGKNKNCKSKEVFMGWNKGGLVTERKEGRENGDAKTVTHPQSSQMPQ